MSFISPITAATANNSLSTVSSIFGQGDSSAAVVAGNDPNAMAPSFGDMLQSALGNVNSLQNKAAEMTQAYATGKTTDIHNVMIAAQQANIALQMTTQLRNQVVSAYQEVMRITM